MPQEEFVSEENVLYFPEPLDCYCAFHTETRKIKAGEYYLVYDPFVQIHFSEAGAVNFTTIIATPTHRVEKIQRWKVLSEIKRNQS